MNDYSHIKVTADWTDDVHNAFHSSGNWKGWAVPYFTFEEALRVAKSIGKVVYDQETDEFVHSFDDHKDRYPAVYITCDGVPYKTYPLGAGVWAWHFMNGKDKIFITDENANTFDEKNTKQVSEYYFCNDNFYSDENIFNIKLLRIGNNCKIIVLGNYHTVHRVF